MRSYEIVKKPTKGIGDHRLHRIIATADIPRHGVKEGDLGGYVESYRNLEGKTAWVDYDSIVYGNAVVRDAYIGPTVTISGNAQIVGAGTEIHGPAEISGCVIIGGSETADETFIRGGEYSGSARIIESIIDGYPIINGSVMVSNSTIKGHAKIGGETFIRESIIVGYPIINGSVTVSNSAIKGHAKIGGETCICDSTIKGHAEINITPNMDKLENGVTVDNSTIVGYVTIMDNSKIEESTVGKMGSHITLNQVEVENSTLYTSMIYWKEPIKDVEE